MKKHNLRLVALCLSITASSSIFFTTGVHAQNPTSTLINTNDKTKVIITNLNDFKSTLKSALSEHKEHLILQLNTKNYKTYDLNTINDILTENPNLCYGYKGCNASFSIARNATTMNLKINYARSSSELNAEKKAAEKKADEIIKKVIKPGMSDFDKELALHDYIVNNSTYNKAYVNSNLPEDHNAYGVLVKGTGVCESYAKAMCLLLKKVGVNCIMVTGNAGGPHAWNKVQIDGQWYNLDTTWDDPIMSNNTQILRHTYFNVTDDMIKKDHIQDVKFSKYIANSTKYYYFNMNKGEIDSKGNNMKHVNGYNQAVTEAIKTSKSGEKFVSLEIKDTSMKNLSTYISSFIKDISSKTRKSISIKYSKNELDNSIIYVEMTFN